MKLILYIASLLLFNLFFQKTSFDITEKQKENALITFNAYREALKQFSNGNSLKSSDIRKLEYKLLDIADSNYSDGQTHFYDVNLFQNRDDIYGDEDLAPWQIYLDIIKNDFNNELEVDFENVNVACIENGNISVQFDKKLQYKGKTEKISEIAIISLPNEENNSPGYKIKFIYSAPYYRNISSTCKDQIKVTEQDAEIEQKTRDANNFFLNKDYIRAKNLYEYINKKNSGNNYISKQVEQCNLYIKKSDYSNKAEEYYNNVDYKKAQYWYEKLLFEYPGDLSTDIIKNKITDCKQKYIEQQYTENIKLADAAFHKSDFDNARASYEKALIIKPGDSYSRQHLEKAKELDDNFARKQIDTAINIYYYNGNYGQYFNILRKYEGYGNHKRLTAKQYYFIVMFLDLQKDAFKRQAGLDESACRQYCRIYCKNLKDALYREPYFEFSDDANRLLLKINKRNQL